VKSFLSNNPLKAVVLFYLGLHLPHKLKPQIQSYFLKHFRARLTSVNLNDTRTWFRYHLL